MIRREPSEPKASLILLGCINVVYAASLIILRGDVKSRDKVARRGAHRAASPDLFQFKLKRSCSHTLTNSKQHHSIWYLN